MQPTATQPVAAGQASPKFAPRPLHPRTTTTPPRTPAPATPDRAVSVDDVKKGRLVSLDAFRGFIMIVLGAAGFGLYQLSQLPADAPAWNKISYEWAWPLEFNFEHSAWQSDFDMSVVSFWDLLQPAFMFMVGVAMPFSYDRRKRLGQGPVLRTFHALIRAVVLVLLGVFLSSSGASQTNWTFVNVLSQIGLGYLFAYLLLGCKFWVQLIAFVLILVGYGGWFATYTPPADYNYAAVNAEPEARFEGKFASWSKNANVAHHFDVWLLNQFPRPEGKRFEFNEGGYQTLNFVPAIGTILLGVFCGQLLLSQRRWWEKLIWLIAGGGACLVLGVLAGEYACPIVKRIWTPSWVLFSGAWVIWGLAIFYFVFDLCRLRWLAFPLVVVGMNSMVFYLMGMLLRPWAASTVETHFGRLLQIWPGPELLADDMFGRLVVPVTSVLLFWLIALWMYYRKWFVRI
jgi:predicted acyltransferase